ncbi:Iron-sulfur cluster co-chaperone protein HscB, mitochondrial, partial [Acipenser ruthenus]
KEQELSEKQSALVNEAYRTLLGPLSRGLYMLKLQGLQLEEDTHFAMEPQFLNEIMEINESLAATQTEEEASDIGHCIQGNTQNWISCVIKQLPGVKRSTNQFIFMHRSVAYRKNKTSCSRWL